MNLARRGDESDIGRVQGVPAVVLWPGTAQEERAVGWQLTAAPRFLFQLATVQHDPQNTADDHPQPQ